MRKASSFTGLMILLLGTVFPAFAASGREDHSSLVVWLFLGFCALIVIAQLVPAMLLLFGMVKGALKGHEPAAQEVARK